MRPSRRIARFNRVVTNPIQGLWAGRVPPWAIVVHEGRTSGRTYRTPVNAFVRGDRVVVGLSYGEDSDWVRNLLAAGHGELVRAGRVRPLLEPKVLDRTECDQLPRGPAFLARKVLTARLGE